MSQVLLFPDEPLDASRQRLLAYDQELRGNPLLESDSQIDRFKRNIGPWVRTLPGRVGNFVVDEGKRIGSTIGGIIDNEIDPMSDEAIQAVFDATGLMALQAPITGARGALGVFGGRMARTADRDALARAERLAEAGADRRAIWDETGWFKGPDGQWRFEIDDSASRLAQDADMFSLDFPLDGRFRDVLDHPALTDAYGMGNQTKVRRADVQSGSFDPPSQRIVAKAPDVDQARSVLLHEGQHGVQAREGFAPGGNPYEMQNIAQQARRAEVDGLRQQMTGLLDDLGAPNTGDFYARMRWFNNDLDPSTLSGAKRAAYDDAKRVGYNMNLANRPVSAERAMDDYRSLAGEVEARNVQTRMDMTPDERRARPPWETQDVPDDMQIVRGRSDGPQMSVENPLLSELPMDEASRMARAREMGFGDTEYYHGTRSDFGEFGRIDGGNAYGDGYYFTKDPADGSRYATGEGVNRITVEGNAGPNVMPVRLKDDQLFNERGIIAPDVLRRLEKAANEINPGYFKRGELAKTFDRAYKPTGDNVLYQLPGKPNDVLRRAGFEGIESRMGTVIFDPSNIRSRFAKFDPAKRGSSDILASMAPIGLGTVGALPLLADRDN